MSSKKLLIIGYVWVDPNASAAGSRMLQLIDVFLAANYQITFATATKKTSRQSNLNSLGIDEVVIKLNDGSFDTFISALMPDVVMFDRFMMEEQFGWRVSECCPNALKILDTEDFHSLRKARELALKKAKEFKETDLLSFELSKREIAAILRCDLSIMISSYEIDLLNRVFKIDQALLTYIPFLFDPIDNDQQKSWVPYDERSNFIFIGNCLHAPNVDAIRQLKQAIWPKIMSQLPSAELHIYVANSTEHINQLHNEKDRFMIKGATKNPDYLVQQARVVLAPLRFGAGQKGKLTEAMRNGTPSVTTSIGAEGMQQNYAWNGFVEDDPEVFAEKALALYTNEAIWSEAQEKGCILINEVFNKEYFTAAFLKRIEEVFQNLPTHRQLNFLGGLLQHHTLQSTKYLSKWIEAKNL